MRDATFAFLAAAALGCSSGPSNLPPVLTGGGGHDPPQCAPGFSCPAGDYCRASAGAGCEWLYCGGLTWACAPEGGVAFDAATDASEVGSPDSSAE